MDYSPREKRAILLKPAPALAARIDVAAAVDGRSAPQFILKTLDGILPNVPAQVPAVGERRAS